MKNIISRYGILAAMIIIIATITRGNDTNKTLTAIFIMCVIIGLVIIVMEGYEVLRYVDFVLHCNKIKLRIFDIANKVISDKQYNKENMNSIQIKYSKAKDIADEIYYEIEYGNFYIIRYFKHRSIGFGVALFADWDSKLEQPIILDVEKMELISSFNSKYRRYNIVNYIDLYTSNLTKPSIIPCEAFEQLIGLEDDLGE